MSEKHLITNMCNILPGAISTEHAQKLHADCTILYIIYSS